MYDKKPVIDYNNAKTVYAIEAFGRFTQDMDRIKEDIYQKLKE